MRRTGIIGITLMLVGCWLTMANSYEALTGPTGVLLYNKDKSFNGYTLFCPTVECTTTYLIDMEGNLIHTWKSKYLPGLYAELLPNGNLLRGGRIPQDPGFCSIGGNGGTIEEIDWNGNVVWEYKLFTPGKEIQHHTFRRMPNGNTLILAWEAKSKKEAIAKGRDPKTVPTKPVKYRGVDHDDFWVDFVRELDKDGKTVWEWHAWDHIGKGPEKLDINCKLPDHVGHGLLYPDLDWTHYNSVDYIPETDKIIISSRNFSEFYIINHKTGKIEYRWGNPAAYGGGKRPDWYDNGDQKMFGNHCAMWLGNDRVLLFDNGSERPEGNRSAVIEVDIKTGKIVWEYESKHSNSFNSFRQGAAQRLANGNTLVTSTHGGHLFEVTPDKEVVWEFVSPVFAGKVKCTVTDKDDTFSKDAHLNAMKNMIHRAYRYGPDFPGLKGKDLSKKAPLGDCPSFLGDWKKQPTTTVTKPAQKQDEDEGGQTMHSY